MKMKSTIIFVIVVCAMANSVLVDHTKIEELQLHHQHQAELPHERATSFQNLHIEHFYPIPLHYGKEHHQLLEHPISIGNTVTKVEVHHGGKHDHGYAIASVHSDLHGHEYQNKHADFAADEQVGSEPEGYAHQETSKYQVEDQGAHYGHE